MYQACLVELLKEKGQIDTDTTNFSKRVLIFRTWSLIRTFLAFWVLIGSIFFVIFGQKCPFSDQKKWHFEWPNQNSKTTFIVQTFPKYGPYGFDLVNLSLLGPILAKFQFCWFSGLFWPFFPCKWGQTRKSFPERQFLVYNAEIFFVNSYNPWAWVVKRTKLNSKKV